MPSKRAYPEDIGQLSLFSGAPDDAGLRNRFVHELEENFSVIAPAGVGKTQSIVDRIAEMAQAKPDWLPQLVVVTFTKRAADEMQQRARAAILARNKSPQVLEKFNRAFFGTIHSFCVELLRNFGHHLGLPAQFELIENDDTLWMDFLHSSIVPAGLSDAEQTRFRRHTRLQKVLHFARHIDPALPCADLPAPKEIDVRELLAHAATGRNTDNIRIGQEIARRWQELWCAGEDFLSLPRFDKGGQFFKETWAKTFGPFREWLCQCALRVSAETARQYRRFRIERALLNYDDQVALASQLLRHPAAARQIRERDYRVILDEAQDTDPAQFHVLLECARPLDADHDWLKSRAQPPAPGRFSMVGDPQQSIYSGRADLARYQKIRELLRESGHGSELAFTTTFRCDAAIIDFVNATFPHVFSEPEQVSFVPLQARPGAGSGKVVRFRFEIPDDLNPEMLDRKRAIIEAEALADWLVENGLPRLRARAWHEVAILVPQRRWFSPVRIALRRVGLRTQIQSPRDFKGDSPAFAWLTALVTIAAHPRNHFEIFGVLREIFGVSDDELAHFSGGHGDRFRIDRETEGKDAVADALNLLARAWRELKRRPLRDAIEELINATSLRARLASLPAEYFENSVSELDDLLALASQAEADELTLADFAEVLRQQFSAPRETRPVEEGAIQLLTAHKAKGLQWDAVILPFLHRREYPPRVTYPRLFRHGAELPALLALEKEDVRVETNEIFNLRRMQERRRLLYVSLTRARHTLVLPDDEALFARKGKVARVCAATALRLHDSHSTGHNSWQSSPGPNNVVWEKLGTELSSDRTIEPAAPLEKRPPPHQDAAAALDQLTVARQRADHFPHRLLPSSFAGHRSDERWRLDHEPEWRQPISGSAAIAYGTWWHELMRALPRDDDHARTRFFAQKLAIANDPARAKKEWELFQGSELARRIFSGSDLIHAEMPLLWRKSDAQCVEGVIDLALIDRDSGAWLIVDWKTDLVETPASLLEAYRGQILAYVEAIAAITQQPASGAIYSTSTGAWLPV